MSKIITIDVPRSTNIISETLTDLVEQIQSNLPDFLTGTNIILRNKTDDIDNVKFTYFDGIYYDTGSTGRLITLTEPLDEITVVELLQKINFLLLKTKSLSDNMLLKSMLKTLIN